MSLILFKQFFNFFLSLDLQMGVPKVRRRSCGKCKGCVRRTDCGSCDFCMDKPKFGGRNKKRQKCRLRQCQREAMVGFQNIILIVLCIFIHFSSPFYMNQNIVIWCIILLSVLLDLGLLSYNIHLFYYMLFIYLNSKMP